MKNVRRLAWAIWIAWGIAAGIALRELHVPFVLELFLIVAVPAAYTAFVKSALRAYDVETRQAHVALKNGDAKLAERGFTLAHRGWPRALARISDYNVSQALLRQGRHAEVIEILSRIDAAGGVIKLDGAIASNLAYAHALLGNVELAGAWHDETARRFARYTKTPAFPYLLSEIAVQLRGGDAAGVRRRLDEQWPQIERELTGERLRPLRVLRAFAVAMSSDAREAGVITPYVDAIPPGRPGENAYLGAHWPELADFLATYVK